MLVPPSHIDLTKDLYFSCQVRYTTNNNVFDMATVWEGKCGADRVRRWAGSGPVTPSVCAL